MSSTAPAPEKGRRGGNAAGDAARERILTAAQEAFSDRGYRGTSLADVGRSVGLTQQGVLYHFPSKAGLLVAVLNERDERDIRRSHSDEKLIGIGVLDAWDETVELNARNYGLVRLAHVLTAEALGADHPASTYFRDHFDIGYDMLLASFQAGVEEGSLRGDCDYTVIARQVIAMSEGLEVQWLMSPDSLDIVRCFHEFTQYLRARITV